MPADLDLIVAGAGPAGRALSCRAARAGLSVALVDPDPQRPWRATYGAWTDELPPWLDAECIAAGASSATVYTPGRRVVERGYSVLATGRLQQSLSSCEARVIAASAASVSRHQVRLVTGETLSATTVIDARGTPRTAEHAVPRQTAVGVRRAASGGEMVVMDWRRAASAPTSTFSYRIALGSSIELVEETCLAGAPPVDLHRLAQLTASRIGGAPPDAAGTDPDVELVDFPLLTPRPPWRRGADEPLRFGAAGGLMHPATGYSVAASLSAADVVVEALTAGEDPRKALWPPSARAVYRLRAAGLTAILRMSPDELVAFFDAFFGLAPTSQYAYLSSRTDLAGVIAAMWQVFARLDRRGRTRLVTGFTAGLRPAMFTYAHSRRRR